MRQRLGDANWKAFVRYAEVHHKEGFLRALTPPTGSPSDSSLGWYVGRLQPLEAARQARVQRRGYHEDPSHRSLGCAQFRFFHWPSASSHSPPRP